MRNVKWISAHQIDQWADAIEARALLPELVRRLIHATVERSQLEHIEFAGSEEGQRPGYDGTTKVRVGGGNAKVPEAIAYWEMGANQNIKGKLDGDFDGRVTNREASGDYSGVTYIGITPRDYQNKGTWISDKKKLGLWGDVRVYDSNDLEQWLETAPAVALWLMPHVRRQNIGNLLDLSSYWENLQRRLKGKIPADVLLTSRQSAMNEFERWLSAPNDVLSMRGQTPHEVVDVFSAWVQSLPKDKQDPIASRAIIVEDETAWAVLVDSPNPLLLVCGGGLQLDAEKIAAAQRRKHHVLRPVTGTLARDAFQIERMDRQELGKRLIAAGMSEAEAVNLAVHSGGWFSVLKRQYSSIPDDRDPAWANAPASGDLAPLLLLGAWTDANAADQEIIASVSMRPYAASRTAVTHWSKQPDAPVRWANGAWEFISLIDAWTFLHKTIEPSHLDAFEKAAVSVLGVDNPALDLPPEERWQASIKGKHLIHSSELRTAIARSLAMLATRQWPNDIADRISLQDRVERAVRKILPTNSSWKRWSSLGGLLSSLAEAAPDAVLEAIEEGVEGDTPILRELFAQESGGVTGRAEHTGLLWALERMAWDKRLLPRVSIALARLAEIDPGGQWSNRPKGSLHHIFFSWMPHTTASLDERIGVLKLLFERHGEVAWELLLGLFPKMHMSIMVQRTPEWRFWAEGWKREMSRLEYELSVTAFVDLALVELEKKPTRWSPLIKEFPKLGRKDVERLLGALESMPIDTLNGVGRKELWEQTSALVENHREFHDAKWAFPKDIVDRFDAIAQRLSPNDPIVVSLALFSHRYHPGGWREMPWEEREKIMSQHRRDALAAITKHSGFDGVLALLANAENQWAVGWELATLGKQFDATVIPPLLVSEDIAIRTFAEAYATSRIHDDIPAARKTVFDLWSTDQISSFVALLPFDRETWSHAAALQEPIPADYWKKTGCRAFDLESADIEFAARNLIGVGRVHSAIDLVGMNRDKPKGKLSADTIMSLLELCAKSSSTERPGQLTGHHIEELIDDVQKTPGVDEERLAGIEWAFLDLLDQFSRHRPETLHKALATQPKFFVDLLCLLYRRRGENEDELNPNSEETKARAERAWTLIHHWDRIPGTQPDGTVSLVELREWMKNARDLADKEGRLVVGDITIGGVLAHSCADPDGTWPCAPVAQIIEETSSTELERGFMTGIFNNRGATTRGLDEGGVQERELAKTFRGWADKILLRFPKVAKLLSRMATDYEAQAVREDLEAEERS